MLVTSATMCLLPNSAGQMTSMRTTSYVPAGAAATILSCSASYATKSADTVMSGLAAWNAFVIVRMSVSEYPACFMNRARTVPLPLPDAPALDPPPPTAHADSRAARPTPPPAASTVRRLESQPAPQESGTSDVGVSMMSPFSR